MRVSTTTIAMIVAAGCGGSGDTSPNGSSRLPVDHIVMGASTESIRVGEAVALKATPVAADGSITGTGISWSSGAQSIATVTASGVVTGVAPGVADIAATSGGKSGHTSVTVTPDNTGPTGDYADVSLDRELYTTCGWTAGGVARCWGHNDAGEVGDGTRTDKNSPAQVSGSVSFAQVSAGEPRSCGRTIGGDVYCWGNLDFVGGNSPDYHSTPTLVAGGLGFADLSVSTSNVCGLNGSGKAYCWGMNANGAIGDGTLNPAPTPIAVSGGITFAQITVGRDFACGRTSAGVAYCWGANNLAQLGDSTKTSRLVPTKVAGNLTFASIAAGFAAVCGVTIDGAIFCWGSTFEVVPGTGGVSLVPAQVSSPQSFVQVAVGVLHACALTAAGAAWCWGGDEAGELGTGSPLSDSSKPVAVQGGIAFAKISAGKSATCGVSVLGALYCWGGDVFGDLGIGGASANVPTLVR